MTPYKTFFALGLRVFVLAQIGAQDQQDGKWDLWVPSHGVDLRVSLTILSVSDIRAASMDFDVDVILDASIVFKSERVCRHYISKLPLIGVNTPNREEAVYWSSTTPLVAKDAALYFWAPSIYVRESIEIFSQNPRSPKFSAKFGGDRDTPCKPVDFTIMRRVRMSCDMDFRPFPLDVQQCIFTITSFSYSQDHVRIAWKDARSVPSNEPLNLRVNPDIRLTKHYLSISTDSFSPIVLNSRNTSGVAVKFVFTRCIMNQLLTNILPAFLLVLVSFSAYLMPTENSSARITLTSSGLLGLIALYSSNRAKAPPSSDSTVSDKWMLGCLTFELLITIQCCLVEQVSSAEAHVEARKSRKDLQLDRKDDVQILVRDFRSRLPTRLQTETFKSTSTAQILNGTPKSLFADRKRLTRHDVELALISLLIFIESVTPWFCRPFTSGMIDRKFRQVSFMGFLLYVVLFWTFQGIYASMSSD